MADLEVVALHPGACRGTRTLALKLRRVVDLYAGSASQGSKLRLSPAQGSHGLVARAMAGGVSLSNTRSGGKGAGDRRAAALNVSWLKRYRAELLQLCAVSNDSQRVGEQQRAGDPST